MARTGVPVQITPVDSENNLFRVENIFTPNLVQQVLATNWLSIPWQRQEGQENWARRRLENLALPWANEWDQQLGHAWNDIATAVGIKLQPYYGTGFWLDEDGFTCSMHTDGELPGSLHMTWIGPGTSFYWHKDLSTLRYQVPSTPNSGYIMINRADDTGYRKLLWHAMLTPVENFRITSYTWITPQ
jgi:hypothetical protein